MHLHAYCVFPFYALPDGTRTLPREAGYRVVRGGAAENSMTLAAEVAALLALVALLLLTMADCGGPRSIDWVSEPEQAAPAPRAEVAAPFREHLTSWEWQGAD